MQAVVLVRQSTESCTAGGIVQVKMLVRLSTESCTAGGIVQAVVLVRVQNFVQLVILCKLYY